MKYKVAMSLRHDGVKYQHDDSVELSDENAKELQALGVVEKNELNDDDRELPAQAIALLFASAELSKEDKPNTKDALKIIKAQAQSIKDPETGQVWEAKDYKIKAELRDQAWDLYLAMDVTGTEEAEITGDGSGKTLPPADDKEKTDDGDNNTGEDA